MKDILAIAGQPGLYKIVSKGSKNLIVESLSSGKRIPAHSTNKIIALEDIAIFTTDGEVQLKEVLKLISEKEDGKASIDHKSSGNVLKKYFSEVLPNFDEDRVYISDIKKVIQWYNILQEKDMLSFEDEEDSTAEESLEENTEE